MTDSPHAISTDIAGTIIIVEITARAVQTLTTRVRAAATAIRSAQHSATPPRANVATLTTLLHRDAATLRYELRYTVTPPHSDAEIRGI